MGFAKYLLNNVGCSVFLCGFATQKNTTSPLFLRRYFAKLFKIKGNYATFLIGSFVFIGAVLVRLWGINFGLPYIFHPDEPVNMNIYLGILRNQDLNPHFFNYPSLFIYLNSFAAMVYYFVGLWLGKFHTLSDLPFPQMTGMGVGITPLPSIFLVGRLLTVLTGLVALLLVFKIGKSQNSGSGLGLLAMAFMAFSPVTVVNDHYITPDSFLTVFALMTLIGAIGVHRTGHTRAYVIAGIGAGLAVSCKYNGFLVLIPVIVAHFLRRKWQGLWDWHIYLVGLLALTAFLATTPYAALDSQKFLSDVQYESNHYSTGHLGMEGNAFLWYLELMWNQDGIIPVLGLIGLIAGILRRKPWPIIAGSFAVVYFLFVSTYQVRNDRTLLVIFPFLYLLAADLLIQLWSWLIRQTNKRFLKFGLAAVFVAGCMTLPVTNVIKGDIYLAQVDSRTTAIDWIRENIPQGSKIAFESYSPYLSPKNYLLTFEALLINQPPSWYVDNKFKYLIFSQGMYKRFTDFSTQYPKEAAQYQTLFDQFKLVKRFYDGEYEILIYGVN